MSMPTTLDEWKIFANPGDPKHWKWKARPVGQWRQEARKAILGALWLIGDTSTAVDILVIVDQAYPFGERRYAPYKAWLAERKIFSDALFGVLPPHEPNAADFAAWTVAMDILEQADAFVMTGQKADDLYEQAIELLELEAPRRHNRYCRACGKDKGQRCVDWITDGPYIIHRGLDDAPGEREHVKKPSPSMAIPVERIAPHLIRIEPLATPQAKDERPLFVNGKLAEDSL